MFRSLRTVAAAALIVAPLPVRAALAPTFATAFVTASVPAGRVGRDAGVDVSSGGFVRLSASGSFAGRNATLAAAFTDATGRLLTGWITLGAFANLPVPAGAKRLVLRANGVTGRELGALRVVADVVPDASPAQLGSAASAHRPALATSHTGRSTGKVMSARTTAGTVGTGPATGVIPTGGTVARSDVQHALRRLGFSATPADVTAVQQSGIAAWVAAQVAAPSPDADASIVPGGNVEALPVLTGNQATDGNYAAKLEDRLLQWQVNTKWQLREKLTLHWLEHFSVSQAEVNNAADMEHYIQTVRADALGNFAKLVADVSKEPAMMLWLNNANNAYNPNTPPNENFGRELMQLYTIGLVSLNPDGSVVPDPTTPGQGLATYGEQDVKTMALALTGFQLKSQQAIGTYPAYVDQIVFNPAAHAPATNGGFLVMGQLVPDGKSCAWSYTSYQQTGLNTSCVVDNAALALAGKPTTWVFETMELLQRLVTETPSPAMIKRISTVWGQTVNDPQQMAKVIAAVAADPEFFAGKYGMLKEPIEFEVDAIRALGGAGSNPVTSGVPRPLSSAVTDTARMSQELWDPPSVFSFYYPGNKEVLLNNAQLLGTWSSATNLAGSARTAACPTCTIFLDFTAFASAATTRDLAGTLLDALVDGGTPQLNALVVNFLNNAPANVQGALWIILTSPEYAVN